MKVWVLSRWIREESGIGDYEDFEVVAVFSYLPVKEEVEEVFDHIPRAYRLEEIPLYEK